MSTNTLSIQSDKNLNEDSIISTSTTISVITEPITQDISKNKNVFIISKSLEQRITEILSYLQSDENLAKNKISIVKYLQSLFLSVEFNSEIFSRKTTNEKEKLNLYKVIIQQYIFYTNPSNEKADEENYRGDLQNLFLLLLSQVPLEKDTYHYILSPLINFIKEKNIMNSNKKNIPGNNNSVENEQVINFTSEHLKRVLVLLKYFYGYYKNEQSGSGVLNYFFFSGDSDSNIIIPNKENPSDNNKKILNLDETLCVMMFIKVLQSEYIKAVYPKINFKLLELRFQDNSNTISINIDIDNQITIPNVKEPLIKLVENEMNCVLIKFNLNKKKSLINCEINVGFNKIDVQPIPIIDSDKEKNQKVNNEIKDIVLFKNFIGICSNIILYKEKKNEGLPKFLFPSENPKLRASSSKNEINNSENNRTSVNWIFPNGIYNEELYSHFAKAELIDQQENIYQKNNNIIFDPKTNYNTFKDFLNNNLIAIYLPSRYIIPLQNDDKNIQNYSQLILIDSINNLNAEFNTRTPALNGIHIYPSLYENDLSILGGISHLLPILELMLDYNELLNKENFSSFFHLLTVYVFSYKFHKALIKDRSNFFKNLSYFLERIPDKFFNDELVDNFKTILGFLCLLNGGNDYTELSKQFHNYILINEKILLKFNEDNQKNLINQICSTVARSYFDFDIIKIIRIMLSYDRSRKYKFCCRDHSQYFNVNCPVMDPDLASRLQPIDKLLVNIFEKTFTKNMKDYSDNTSNNQTKITKKSSSKSLELIDKVKFFKENNLYYLFYLLTYNISPCLQKSILGLLINFLKDISFEDFILIFDKNKDLFELVLFVFRTSISDVKHQAMQLFLLMDKRNNWVYLGNLNIRMFVKNEMLPIFLIDNVQTDEKEENKEEIKNNNIEEKKENQIGEKKNKYGIKKELIIDGFKYNLFTPSEIEKKVYKKYNKKKFNYFVNYLYEHLLLPCINEKDIFMDLILHVVSNGDLLLISSFLSKIKHMIVSQEIYKDNIILYNEVINNNNFFQFILDVNLQIYILRNNKDKNKTFIPSFSLDISNNSIEGLERPLNENEKNEKLKNALEDCEKIILFILTENITKLDYVLTWGKYYERLSKENSLYNFVFTIIDDIFLGILSSKSKVVVTLSERSDVNESQIQSTLYYLNIYFEFITYFKLKYDDSFFQMNKTEMDKILEENLKYVLCDEDFIINERLTPVQEMQKVDDKMKSFTFITIVLKILNPIWIGGEKKTLKNENEIYTKHLNNSVNKNLYNNELEILFYSFDEKFFKPDKNKFSNKGIKMISILYHFFICLLNVGGEKRELNDCLVDFRFFLLLLIIGPPTINISESFKKKRFPNEAQNEEMRTTIQYILFDSIFFLYSKLRNLKNQENDYKSKPESEINKKNIECILTLRRFYMVNLGFILKILNKIYRGVKHDENKNKGFMSVFGNKMKIIERIKNSGAFCFINDLYNECFITLFDKTKTFSGKGKKIEIKDNKDNKEQSTDEINKEINNKNELSKSTNINLDVNSNNSGNLTQNNENTSDINLDAKSSKSEQLSLTSNANNNIVINIEKNCLDDISSIDYTSDGKEINISEKNYQKLETYMNSFLENQKIQEFFEKHLEYNTQNLYSFVSSIQIRQKKMQSIIPAFDNRKNISNYPNDLCLIPYYYSETMYKAILMKKVEDISKKLREEIRMSKRILDVEEIRKEEDYRNDKKKLFKFRGIWSYEDFFYDIKKYRLKYKILHHYTNDFTKIFLTPITDIDYYLPKFSQFKGNIFRSELNEASLFPITKIIDICLSKNKRKNEVNNNVNNTISNNATSSDSNNISMISFDSLNFSSISNLNDTKLACGDLLINPQFELNQEYYSFLTLQEIKESKEAENSINVYNPKDFEIFSDFIEKNHLKGKGIYLQCEACLVKLPYHIRGIIFVNNEEIGFYSYDIKKTDKDEDYDSDKKTCFGSIFKEAGEKYKNYFIKLRFEEVEIIFKRRYYFKKNVLEIFTQNKKSYFFRIDETKFDRFFEDIIENNQKSKFNVDFEYITIENAKSEEKIGLVNKSNLLYDYNDFKQLFFSKKFSTIKNIYTKWTKWEISTFTLLNFLNLFASRSYNDINQYPVFPWIITDYKSKEIPDLSLDNDPNNMNNSEYIVKIRPMGTPMGMLDFKESARERKENYLINFDSPDEKNLDENFDRYGSHYSTGLNLTYYLVRSFPYSYTRIEMQGKNFDDPNRLFNDLDNSFECAISQKSDLRELIPEFFCFPEMFYNMNDLNLGSIKDEKTKQMKPVNDILLPPYSNNDGYQFIKIHRELLESIEISDRIHEWFNIIFGSKQKGRSAKKINNQFLKQTYDDFDEVHNHKEFSDKIYENRMVEFGVTPSQVFKNDVDKRLNIKNLRKKPILFELQIKKEKKVNNKENKFSLDDNKEIKIRESELYIEGDPSKIFSSWKKDEEHKHEKMLFLYNDKVKIITKTEKSIFKKSKAKHNKDNKENKDSKKETKEKQILKQEEKENKEINNDNKENNIKEETKENSNEENKEKEKKEETENNIDEKNEQKIENVSIAEEENEIKDEEISEITSNKDVSKYDRVLIYPKYHIDMNQSPSIIYDRGSYIALGGFWNGEIIINKLDDNEKGKKNKNLKYINIISTDQMSPINIMKIDESDSFVICSNKMGCVFIYTINKDFKLEWNLFKIIHDNQKEITSLDLNENLNVFITCDKEGINNLYTFPQCKLFNSYKLNENQLPANSSLNDNNTLVSRTESNTNLNLTQNEIYADVVIISHNPLPCIIFYIHAKKCLCVFSINFHLINVKYNIEIVPNGIKKYSDYFRKDFLFIYNKNLKQIDIYDIINLNVVLKSSKFDYTFVDFCFNKEMEHALIMVKIEDEKKLENTKDKNNSKLNYKILMLNTPEKTEGKSN